MSWFRVHSIKVGSNDSKIFWYNNQQNLLYDENKEPLFQQESNFYKKFLDWSKQNPATKSRDIRRLKIQLGLSCNYSCSYCSQRFIPHADSNNLPYVETFIDKMPKFFQGGEDGLGKGVKIEFWGGEPFVYWKTLKILAEKVREKYPNANFGMISNCTLLDDEKIEWLDRLGFAIGMSHDGESYKDTRGDDPLLNPEKYKYILKLYNLLAPKGRMSINCVMNKNNISKKEVQKYLSKYFNPEYLFIGEGSIIDAFDEGGISNSLVKRADQLKYRNNSLEEVRNSSCDKFTHVKNQIEGFINGMLQGKPREALNQKCGIDSPHNVTVDLKGNVITCQNVSPVSIAMNGEKHLSGHIDDFDNVRVKTITHWSHRPNCKNCPVLHLCKGSCTFTEGKFFDVSCQNSFSDNIVYFATAVEIITNGYLPYYIEGDNPKERHDIWGWVTNQEKSDLEIRFEKEKLEELSKQKPTYNFNVNGARV